MFKQLEATNFRQHKDLQVDFTAGINAIRGANEKGKSSMLEAIGYALGGAKTLRESLAETVTWGLKESELHVKLSFEVNGSIIAISRSKAGAEAHIDGQLKVTGQTEVTKFCESLLGASMDTMSKLMMASQTDLRGALKSGPAAAVALIESLANFSLIDEIVNLVQTKLPNGNTVGLDSRIVTLREQVAEPLEDTTAERQIEVDAADLDLQAAELVLTAAKELVADQRPKADEARASIAAREAAKAALDRATQALQNVQAARDAITVPAEPDLSEIPKLEKAITQANQHAAAVKAHAALKKLPEGDEWDEGLPSLTRAIVAARERVAAAQADAMTHGKEAVRLKAMIIKETHCAFCDKDLRDVPEVTSRNDELNRKVAAADTAYAAARDAENEAAGEADALNNVMAANMGRQSAYQAAAQWIELDEKYVPARWTWTGPDTDVPADTAAAAKLAQIRAAVTARAGALGRKQQAEAAATAAGVTALAADSAYCHERDGAEGAEAVLAAYDETVNTATVVETKAREARQTAQTARQALKHASDMLAVRRKARDGLQAQLLAAEKELVDTNFNNALLKKLRSARPQVADKLWAIVLSSVSRYFSAIRGVQSVVTRENNSFKVDGQTIGGLSGSTLDALGLAIRIALTKTFLPNSRFMVLDEPGAACDDERETAMLGLVATSDFDQVLLVTHSNLADAFAENMIQL